MPAWPSRRTDPAHRPLARGRMRVQDRPGRAARGPRGASAERRRRRARGRGDLRRRGRVPPLGRARARADGRLLHPDRRRPRDFGRIAAANALSDVYAMGARPVTALNLVAFSLERLGGEVLAQILAGGAEVARGPASRSWAVTRSTTRSPSTASRSRAWCIPDRVVRNSTARPGDALFLTKPIGGGAVTTAAKRGTAPASGRARVHRGDGRPERGRGRGGAHRRPERDDRRDRVRAARAPARDGARQRRRGRVEASAVPALEGARAARRGALAGGSRRNREWVEPHVRWADAVPEPVRALLCDAMTSGGLLIAVPQRAAGWGSALERARPGPHRALARASQAGSPSVPRGRYGRDPVHVMTPPLPGKSQHGGSPSTAANVRLGALGQQQPGDGARGGAGETGPGVGGRLEDRHRGEHGGDRDHAEQVAPGRCRPAGRGGRASATRTAARGRRRCRRSRAGSRPPRSRDTSRRAAPRGRRPARPAARSGARGWCRRSRWRRRRRTDSRRSRTRTGPRSAATSRRRGPDHRAQVVQAEVARPLGEQQRGAGEHEPDGHVGPLRGEPGQRAVLRWPGLRARRRRLRRCGSGASSTASPSWRSFGARLRSRCPQ